MHEGLSVEAFEEFKKGLPVGVAKAKTIAWSNLSKTQFDSLSKTIGMGLGVAQKLWADPESLSRVDEADVDTSVLGAQVKSETSALGWFLYFLKEAKLRSDKTSAQKEEMLTIMRRYLRKPAIGTGSELKGPLESVDQTQLRTDLTALLKMGFSALSGYGQGHDQDDCSDAALLQFRRSGQVYQEVDYRWRADSRGFATIRDDQGFKTKADSEGYAKANGMRAPFHPFSDPTIRKYLWFRRGQTDNCLYTVVSIGKSTDWKGYLPFPKIEQTVPKALFTAGGRAPVSSKYSEKYAMCRVGSQTRSIKLPVTETWLYMFLLTGLVIETNRIQTQILGGDAFPEEGVQEIPLGDIYGAVRFYRFHHGPTDEDGFTAIAEPGGVLHFANPQFQATKYSTRGAELLKRAFGEVADLKAPLSVKWTAHGYSETSKSFTFKGEKIDEILKLSLQT